MSGWFYCSRHSHFCFDLTTWCVSEVEKQTIPHGMREIHFNTHVVNSIVLNQFVTVEKKKCPIILWQGSLNSNLLVKICYDIIIISVLLYLDSIWGKYLKNIIGLTSNKILKQHFNITTNRGLIHIMSSVCEITVKGCWSPDQVSMRISKGETGQVNWSHTYISYKYPATVEFHPLSLFSSCGR